MLEPEPEPDPSERPYGNIFAGSRAVPGDMPKLDEQSTPCEQEEDETSHACGKKKNCLWKFLVAMIPREFLWNIRSVQIWLLLAYGVVASTPASGNAAPAALRPSISLPPSTPPASRRNALIDTLEFGSGTVMCIGLVVGARYWRGSWGLPAPTMGASGIAFLLWKNDDNVSAEVTWITFAVWATATLVNMWTAKYRLPVRLFTTYIIASSVLAGLLIYIFAAAFQERIITAVPLCAAFSFYAGEVALRKRTFRVNGPHEEVVQEKAKRSKGNKDETC